MMTDTHDAGTGETRPSRTTTWLRSLQVLGFLEDGFDAMRDYAGWKLAAFALLLCVLFQALPTSAVEVGVYPQMVLFYLLKFIVLMAVLVLIMKRLGSTQRVATFVSATSLTYLYAMVVSTFAAYASLLVFDWLLGITVVSGVVRSFIPYYSSVLFGWCAENLCGLDKKWKRIAIGIIAITLLLIYILYIDYALCVYGVTEAFGLAGVLCA